MNAKVNVVDENGFTKAERAFRAETGARWHNGSAVIKRGWYLPFDGGPMTANDRARYDKYPFGIFMGATVKKARATFNSL